MHGLPVKMILRPQRRCTDHRFVDCMFYVFWFVLFYPTSGVESVMELLEDNATRAHAAVQGAAASNAR